MAISFNEVGTFQGVDGGPNVVNNPTSLQFGPDGRLYVSEQNGSINAFTVTIENGTYIATDHEELTLPGGGGVVKSIQNHDDDGSPSGQSNRQVTGIVVTGTAENPVLYVSSSDPRISANGEVNLDTNSGVVTRVTWTGTEWEAVDLIRGLPRSEENHSTNGLVIDEAENKLYLTIGGNTNNGAPSQFFSYTNEYVLSGSVIEIDLDDIESRPILTDPDGGQGGAARSYVYDLPTLDDPSVPNDGVREDADGMDVAGPWGGNDGLNMAVLPADAPFRIFADGLRNAYDLAFNSAGQLYTVDNGSNGNLGGDPNTESGDDDGDGVAGEAIATPQNGGSGDPEPLFLIEDGGYYGHPNPARANQNLAWTVYDNSGNPDGNVTPNTVPDLSALVPDPVQIQDGFLIDPTKFTGDPNRLFQSGVRVERDSAASNALVTVGSSSNGLVEFDSGGTAFGGALDGALLVTQFNDNVTALRLNATGDGVEPIVDPGPDGVLGTADDFTPAGAADGTYQLPGFPGNLTNPLDITVAPDGSVWVAEIASNDISVWVPSDVVLPDDPDFDNDGIFNVDDPFTRDPTNGGSVTIVPGAPFLWSFAASGTGADFPGPDGYGGGLTGVMVNGTTDFEAFFQEPSDAPGQDVKLDNVKFNTAAGGGSTVVELVSNGDPFLTQNDGEYLFHTGVTIAPTVETFNVRWSFLNPGDAFTGTFQQIGGYIGTGDQSNYLKLVAIQHPDGEIQFTLEDDDTVTETGFIQADDLFAVTEADAKRVFLDLLVDPAAATATPTVTYEVASGPDKVVSGPAIDLSGSNVLAAINGNHAVQGQTSGLAVGLFSSNTGEPAADTFQAVFDDIEITATEAELPPDAVNDIFTTPVNAVLTIPVADLLANDVDLNVGDTLAVTAVTANDANATVVLDDNGTPADPADDVVKVTPATDFEGTTSFDYEVTDSTGLTDVATADVTVADRLVLYRVNAGGPAIAASDGGPNWEGDTSGANSAFLAVPGSNNTASFAAVEPGPTVDPATPGQVFDTERWDNPQDPAMQWEFPVAPGVYEVRLFVGNGFTGTSQTGQRIYDVAIEGTVPTNLDDLDLSATFGHEVGAMIENQVTVTDGTLDIDFLHGVENPLVNAIEIVQLGTVEIDPTVSIISGDQVVDEGAGQVQISLATDITVPSDETVDVTIEIVPGSATPGEDYAYAGGTFDPVTGVYTDTLSIAGSSSDLTLLVDILDDAVEEASELFTVNVVDVSANAVIGTDTATVTIADDDQTLTPGEVLVRINAGGPEVAATDGGPAWSADQGDVANGTAVAGPSSPFLVDRGIDGTTTATSDDVTYGDTTPVGLGTNATGAPDALFTTERFSTQANPDNIGYAFDLPNGDYTVNLYFDEIFFTQAGERVFDVALEGTTVLDDFDTFATYGNDTGVESFDVSVSDGELNLEFLKTPINNPHVAAIEIVAADDGPPADTVDGAPVPGGDLASDPAAPTPVALPAGGTTTLVSNLEGGNADRDFFTLAIPDGYRLTEILLDGYVADPNNNGFFGLKEGADFVIDPAIPPLGTNPDGIVEPGDLSGGIIYGPSNVGANLLPLMNDTAVFAGFDPDGLTGEVTGWLNQGGGAVETTLTFVTEEIPSAGEVVAAINAGGPALTQDGIDFTADQFFDNGTVFVDGTAGNGPQPGFDGTIYETERYGGAPGDPPLSYSIPVGPGAYAIELHFAEIFHPSGAGDGIGERVFDVFVEGELVLDDFDILSETGGDIDQPIVLALPDTVSPDDPGGDDPAALDITLSASVDNAKLSGIVVRDATPPAPTGGAATLAVNDGSNDIQQSNFGNGSFVLTNTGTKDIVSVTIDVTDALYPDGVFDPFGVAGDTIGKPMTIDGGSGTGVSEPAGGYYGGAGGQAGFEQVQLDFDPAVDGGFDPGESVAFAVDMDPNSIAGAEKSILDPGAQPAWDIGGIGGAELIGSSFTVTFADGTTATGQLLGQTDASGAALQGGSDGLASQDSPGVAASLTVNGVTDGGAGTYADGGPTVLVDAPVGSTVRVTMTKGIIQPVDNQFPDDDDSDDDPGDPATLEYADILDAQLAALAASDFPANNAAFFETFDVTITEPNQDISNLFNFADVPGIDLAPRNESQLPLGFVATVIDPANGDAPLGPVSSPIHLAYAANTAPTIDPIADISIQEGEAAAFSVNSSDAEGDPIALAVEVTRDGDGSTVDPAAYAFTDDGDGTGDFAWTTGEPDDGAYTVTVTADDGTAASTETLALVVDEVADPQPGTVLYRVNAGGTEQAAADGGPAWTEDTAANNSPFLVNPGSNNTFPGSPNTGVDLSAVAGSGVTPEVIGIERWDNVTDANGEMAWAFDVAAGTEVEVRLYLAELFTGLPDLDGSGDPSGDRIFDVGVDGTVPAAFDDLDPYVLAGNAFAKASVVSHTLTSDGTVDLEFLHVSENPAVKAIELAVAGEADAAGPEATLATAPDVVAAGETYEFTVVYADQSGVDVSTLDDLDVTVSNGAAAFAATATLVSVDSAADGSPRTATYAITPPGGAWDAADNGTYEIALAGGAVADILGNAAPAGVLGTFEVAVPSAKPSALVEITPDGGLGASTFGAGSFEVTNTSEPGVQITSVSIDLSTGILPDMVFDPTGSGGDATAVAFTPDAGASETGLVEPVDPAADPFSAPRNGGFDVLTADFTDFDPSETFTFTTDVDPNNIQGVAGAGQAGAVSGYELVGATVAVSFSDGTTLTGSLYEDGSLGGGQVLLDGDVDPTPPTIALLGAGPDESGLPGTQVTVNDGPDQVVRVSGTPGQDVSLLQMDARLFIASGDPPFDVTADELPFYANEAMAGKALYDGVIGPDGFVDIPVTLIATDGGSEPDGGLNHFVAVTAPAPYAVDAPTGRTSETLVVKQGAPLVYDAPGVMSFDGTSASVLEIPHAPAFAVPSGTVAFSFTAGTVAGRQGLFAKDASGATGGGNHMAIWLEGDQLNVRQQDGPDEVYMTFDGIVPGEEYEVATTFGPNGAQLFVDGNLVDEAPVTMDWSDNVEFVQWGGLGWASASGAPGFTNPFDGEIADKQIYGSVLTPSEIAALAATSSAGNTPPVALDDTVTVAEDDAVTFQPGANDADDDGDTVLAAAIAAAPGEGTAVVNPDGSVTYTPAPDFAGTDAFAVEVTDGRGGVDTADVAVTVTPVNDDPVANDDTAVAILETPLAIDVTANDEDVDGDALDVVAVTQGSDGTVTIAPDGTVTYTPDAGYTGPDSFTYTVEDGAGGAPATATVDVTVLPAPNTPPVALDDAVTVAEDDTVTFQPGANDADDDGDTVVAAAIATDPSFGSATVEPDGTVTYAPDPDYAGADAFTVTVTDGNGGFDTSVVAVTVTPENDPPVANDDAATTFAGEAVVIDLLANDTDVDPGTLSIQSVAQGANGTVSDNGNGTVTYTPDAGFTGEDTFGYVLTDGTETAAAEVAVTVSGLPDPILDAPAEATFSGSAADVIELPHDPAYAISAGTVNLAFTAATLGGVQGLFAKDASGASGGGNHMAIWLDGDVLNVRQQAGPEEVYLTFDGIVAGEEYEVATTFGPDGAKLFVDGDLVDEAPVTMDWSGNVEFIQWGGLGWASASGAPGFTNPFTGTIAERAIYGEALDPLQIAELHADGPANADPTAVDDAIVVAEDGAITFDPADNDVDVDGDTVTTAAIAAQPANGTAVLEADDSVTYTPDPDFFGTDSFAVTVADGNGGSATSTVDVTVTPVDDDPVAADDAAATEPATPVVIDVLANDGDVDGDPLAIDVLGDPANGTVVENPDGTVTYTPDAGFLGEDTFTYAVSDGAGPTDTATVTVAVEEVVLPPDPILSRPGMTSFSGAAGDVENLPHDPAFAIPEGTIAFSFVDQDPGTRQGLVVKDASGNGSGGHFAAYLDGGDLNVRFQDATDGVTFSVDVQPDQEYEVAAVFDPDGVELFVDGASVGASPLVMDWGDNEEFLQLGGLGWGSGPGGASFTNPFSGELADVAIYDQALEEDQIALLAAQSSFDLGL